MTRVVASVNGKQSLGPGAAFLLVLTLLAYLPALWAGFIWDDNDYVTANTTLRDVAGLARIWTDIHGNWQYYPLVFTSFWLEFHAWALHPLGYHLDNVILHAASAVLLWRLLLRLRIPSGAALLAAAILAVHPVEVESVAWVTERKNVLCGLFYLAAMHVYFNPKPTRGTYAAAAGLFLCAMLSKTVAVTWPAAVLVIQWWKTGRIARRDVLAMIPFALIGVTLGLLTSYIEIGQVGAGGRDWDFTFADRCIIAGRAVWFYALTAISPFRLSFIYPRWDLHVNRSIQAAAASSAAILLLVLFLQTRRWGRGPAAAALLFAGTLAPALGFVDFYPMRYSFVADHFQYLAIIPLIVAAAFVASRALGPASLIIPALLVVVTFVRCGVYRDPVTLWTDTADRNPSSWMVHENLGQAFEANHEKDRAAVQYVQAAVYGADEPDPWWKLGEFQANAGDFDAADSSFRHALSIDPNDPVAKADLDKLNRLRGR